MTNKESHEEAAGMNLNKKFFEFNNIDPDAEYVIGVDLAKGSDYSVIHKEN